MRALALLPLVFAACSGGDQAVTVVVVTLDAAFGVAAPNEVTVTVRNGNDMVARMFMAAPVTFPSTFSVTPHDRSGALVVEAQGTATDGRTAHAVGQVDIIPAARADVHVVLLPDDYILNSRRAGAQVTSFGLGARQLAAAPDGTFALIYEDTCPQNGRCDIWARLFDAGGAARTNQISQDNADFIVNSSPTGTLTRPSIAAVPGGGLLGAWKILDVPNDLRVRALGSDGTPMSFGEQSVLATTASMRPPDNIMVAALDRNRFLVAWQQERNPGAANEPFYIHARVVLADGTMLPEFQVNLNNPPAGQLHATDDHVAPYIAAAADGSFVVTWTRGSASCTDTFTTGPCEVRARWFDAGGGLGPESTIPAILNTPSILPVAVAVPGGYLFVWSDKLRAGPDTDSFAIVARGFDGVGAPRWPGQAVLDTVTTGEQSAPSVAAQPDGKLFVLWTDCSMKGVDTDGCGIRGRALLPFGLPVGDDVPINTTTQGRQDGASVIAVKSGAFFGAWNDSGMTPPDTDGAVRGRFLSPAFDRNDGVLGASCDADHPCGTSLVCTPRGSTSLCHVACTQVGQACDTGGVCAASSGAAGGTSCQYP